MKIVLRRCFHPVQFCSLLVRASENCHFIEKGCTNQGFQSIVPYNDELDSYFVFSRTDELKQYGELVGAGSTFVEVSGKQMAAMNLKMPTTIEEQQTIGRFFKRLDTLITLHQREHIKPILEVKRVKRNE